MRTLYKIKSDEKNIDIITSNLMTIYNIITFYNLEHYKIYKLEKHEEIIEEV